MPNQPDPGNRDEQIQSTATTLDDLFVDLADNLQRGPICGGDPDLCDLGVMASYALQSEDRLTVLHAQCQLILTASRLLIDFGVELGRGED